MVIGKSARHKVFKDVNHTKYVYYTSNSTAWMTGIASKEFLSYFDRQMATCGINDALLIMDNAPSHDVSVLRLKHTKVVLFPANVTSILQPLDKGNYTLL